MNFIPERNESICTDEPYAETLHHHRSTVDENSPPVDPLPFPAPAISSGRRQKIFAKDHKSKESHIVNALIQGRDGETGKKAYFLKKMIKKSADGNEKTWLAIVLAPHLIHSTKHDNPFETKWQSTDEVVLIKSSAWRSLSTDEIRDTLQKLSALQYIGINNPHAVGCSRVLQDKERYYAVLPYRQVDLESSVINLCDKTAQREHLIPSEMKARVLFEQLCKGLLHLQRKGLYHGNISMKSLVIGTDQLLSIHELESCVRVPFADPCNAGYVIPQGTCRRLIPRGREKIDDRFLAPEVISGDAFDSFAADVWSAGVVLFVMLTRVFPFEHAKPSDVIFKVVSRGDVQLLVESWGIPLSREACDLLQRMLSRKPNDRISIEDIFAHPWMTGPSLPVPAPRTEHAKVTDQLPSSYVGRKMQMLRTEITQRKREEKSDFARKMRQSLRKELTMRCKTPTSEERVTCFDAVQVHDIDTPSPTCESAHGGSEWSVQEQEVLGVAECEQRSKQASSTTIDCSKTRRLFQTKAVNHAMSSDQVLFQCPNRRQKLLRRFVNSAKKKLKGCMFESTKDSQARTMGMNDDAGSPFLVSARSA